MNAPSVGGAFIEEPLFIERPGARLFAMLHCPPGGPMLPAFLFCHPFAEEKKNSHRFFVDLARALAARGAPVLRFDFFGCGDSEGDFADATISTRLEDIRTALSRLRGLFPDREVGLVGLRLGATLAAVAAQEDPCVSRLALIEPIFSGRTWFAADLRRMLIKQMMTDGRSSADRRAIIERLERGEGVLDFDGWTISGALYRELVALDVECVRPAARRVLLVNVTVRDALTPEIKRLAEGWRGQGLCVDARALVMPPIWNRLELVDSSPLVAAVCAWLEEGA